MYKQKIGDSDMHGLFRVNDYKPWSQFEHLSNRPQKSKMALSHGLPHITTHLTNTNCHVQDTSTSLAWYHPPNRLFI